MLPQFRDYLIQTSILKRLINREVKLKLSQKIKLAEINSFQNNIETPVT